ncbi:MAG: hypothetical protein AB8G26_18260 [Ilumatobacter sp.]
MLRRLLMASLAACALMLSTAPLAHGAPEPVVPRPEVSGSAGDRLVPVPAGCPVPEVADVAFVGTVVAKDGFIEKGTVRYRIDQVRAGDAAPFAVGGLIDVRYGPDSQYLDVDSSYLVSAAVDPTIAALASKVSPEAPLFGGDAVIGVEDTETECPAFDDPVMTINVDGTPVESGLLTPLFEDTRLLLATIGVPAAVVAGALVGLVLLRRLLDLGFRGIVALGRAAVTPSPDHRAGRVRRHLSELEATTLPDDGSATGPVRSDGDLVDSTGR